MPEEDGDSARQHISTAIEIFAGGVGGAIGFFVAGPLGAPLGAFIGGAAAPAIQAGLESAMRSRARKAKMVLLAAAEESNDNIGSMLERISGKLKQEELLLRV